MTSWTILDRNQRGCGPRGMVICPRINRRGTFQSPSRVHLLSPRVTARHVVTDIQPSHRPSTAPLELHVAAADRFRPVPNGLCELTCTAIDIRQFQAVEGGSDAIELIPEPGAADRRLPDFSTTTNSADHVLARVSTVFQVAAFGVSYWTLVRPTLRDRRCLRVPSEIADGAARCW